MAVASASAQHTHPRSRKRTRVYVCPGCGEERTTTYENYRRIMRGEQSKICRGCPGKLVIQVTEEHRRFWLQTFGVEEAALSGTTAAAYVSEHGVPRQVLALAASVEFFV